MFDSQDPVCTSRGGEALGQLTWDQWSAGSSAWVLTVLIMTGQRPSSTCGFFFYYPFRLLSIHACQSPTQEPNRAAGLSINNPWIIQQPESLK